MLETSPVMFHTIVAAVGLLLFLFMWFATRDFPPAVKVLARLALIVVAVTPIVLALLFGAGVPEKQARPPAPPAQKQATAPPAAGTPPPSVSTAPSSPAPAPSSPPPSSPAPGAAPSAPTAPTEKSAESTTRAPVTTAPPPATTAPQPAPTPAPKSAEVPAAAPADQPVMERAQPPAKPATRSAGARSAPAPAAGESPDWDIVPVFYGTDRANENDPKRAKYSADRANRLELGRALVTVPKSHQTPLIERPWAYRVPFLQLTLYEEAEDPKKHFTLKDVGKLTEEEFLTLVKERLAASKSFKDHALVFVHGFNTSFDYALYRTAQIAYDLKFDGAPFVYSWPSRGSAATPFDYTYDRESAEIARPHLKAYLELVAKKTGATSVSIIAHSMGNQVLLPVLEELKREAPEGVRISEVILAAPDMERLTFQNFASRIAGFVRGVTLYASANDRALQASKRFWGGDRAGEVPQGGPIILQGLDTIDVTNTSTDMFSLGHSGYAETTELINDIQLLLQTGERPPKQRVPILETVNTASGDYWRYPTK